VNPLLWERRHQTALIISALIGSALGVVLGYMVYGAASGSEAGASFKYWLGHPLRYGWPWWGVFGAAVASGAVYVQRLNSN
jgi:hypothetical protein